MKDSARPTKVLGVIASPDRRGRTQEVVRRALAGAAEAGAETEAMFLANYALQLCSDCRPWTCRSTHRCRHDRDGHFAFVADRFLSADAVVFGTPVYYGIASEGGYAFMQRMHRTQANQAQGVPALGIAIAGGSGGGLVSGLRPMYHFFQMMGMRAIRPLPATRFNWRQVLDDAHHLGKELAVLARAERRPFVGLERLAHYDDLPYLNMSRVEERALLAGIVVEAVAGDGSPEAAVAREAYAEARRLLEIGERTAALPQIERAYAAGLSVYEGR